MNVREYGKWAVERDRFLKNHKKKLYKELLKDGEQEYLEYLNGVQIEATDLEMRMQNELKLHYGATIELKNRDFMGFVQLMSKITAEIEDLIRRTIIYPEMERV